MSKTCTKCKQEKELVQFNKDRTRKDGLFPWCRPCKRVSENSRPPEYKIWRGIRARCGRYKEYKHLSVHESWLGKQGFNQFIADMGPRPSDAHQIDRIDNTQGYSPENCRWVTKTQNTQNRRRHRHKKSSKYKGVFYAASGKRKKRWFAIIAANGKRKHLGIYLTQEEAAAVYNEAALLYHKEFAVLNNIEKEVCHR